MRILLEASTESEWVAQHLETLGHEAIVADPNFAPMYGQRSRRVKTDRRDVAALADACQRGFYRAAHRRSATAADRADRAQCPSGIDGQSDASDLAGPRRSSAEPDFAFGVAAPGSFLAGSRRSTCRRRSTETLLPVTERNRGPERGARQRG